MKPASPSHPSAVRTLARLLALRPCDCKAKTLPGLLARIGFPKAIPLPLGELGHNNVISRHGCPPLRSFTPAEREVRRAVKDAPFRATLLRALRTEESKLMHSQTIGQDSPLAAFTVAADRRVAVRARLFEIATKRAAIKGGNPVPVTLPVFPGVTVPLGSHPDIYRRLGAALDMRGKDAQMLATFGSSRIVSSPGQTTWRNGRAVAYKRATRDNYLRSFAVIRNAQTLGFALLGREYAILLPDSYRWDVDSNGLRIVRVDSPRDDYHPFAHELHSAATVAHSCAGLISALEHNRARRLEIAVRTTAEAAQAQGVYVCLADSLRAGNCRAGTEAFAARHNLDLRRHYSAPELLTQANGDASRVRLAISAARLRHERESAQGFALLADHRVA